MNCDAKTTLSKTNLFSAVCVLSLLLLSLLLLLLPFILFIYIYKIKYPFIYLFVYLVQNGIDGLLEIFKIQHDIKGAQIHFLLDTIIGSDFKQ